ncbi:MAG: UDP-N-acetylglucosamine 2-epimerase [Acidimicrobiales bacterium]
MKAIQERPSLLLQTVVTGTMELSRFDQPVREAERDGFTIDGRIQMELEGSTPVTMAKSIGIGVTGFASEFDRLAPSVVLAIGDRYEALAAVIAAVYMNITVVHVQGGEVSGSIDESARHAITKLAHYHFPSTLRARDYLVRMGERPETILGVGCPSSDLARCVDRSITDDVLNGTGEGAVIDPRQPFIIAAYHPTTTEYGTEQGEMQAMLDALTSLGTPSLLFSPNIDAGAERLSLVVHKYILRTENRLLRLVINMSPENYLKVLALSACAVGNSSSFVRDASYFGTPVVLVGNRQRFRESADHVVNVQPTSAAIRSAVTMQMAHGVYPASTLYGDGHVSKRLVDAIESLKLYSQKHLAYVDEFGA